MPPYRTCTTATYILPLENHILFARMSIFLDDCLRLDALSMLLLPMASSASNLYQFRIRILFDMMHVYVFDVFMLYTNGFFPLSITICPFPLRCRTQIKRESLCLFPQCEWERYIRFEAWISDADAICDEIRFNLIKLMGKSWFWLS